LPQATFVLTCSTRPYFPTALQAKHAAWSKKKTNKQQPNNMKLLTGQFNTRQLRNILQAFFFPFCNAFVTGLPMMTQLSWSITETCPSNVFEARKASVARLHRLKV
jgi:hypothetical protein